MPGRRLSFRARLALIALAGLAVRVVYALTVAGHDNLPVTAGDRFFFVEGAKLLASGHGFIHPFVWDGFHLAAPSAAHPPLWMIVLAPLAKLGLLTFTSARVAGAVVGTAAVAVAGLVGRRMGGDRAGLVVAALAAAYPAWIVADASGMSEALYVTLVGLALLAVLRARESPTLRAAALTGAAVGLAALTRSEAVLLLPLLVWPALWRRGRRPLLVATGVAALVVAPWAIRNAVELHRFVPISTNDATVLAGANCDATYHGPDTGSWLPSCLAVSGHVDPRGYDEGAAAAAWEHAGLAYAHRHAGRWPAVAAVRALRTWRLWQPLRAPVSEGESAGADRLAAVWFLLLLLPAGALGIARAPLRRDHRLALVALAAMVTVASVLGWGSPRFLRPAELGLLVGAGVLAAARVRRPRLAADTAALWRSRWFRGALVVALVLRVAVVVATPHYHPFADPSDYARYGTAIAHTGAYPRAALGGGPSAYRPPVYPAFVAGAFAASGDGLTFTRLAQALVGVVTVALLALLVVRIWGVRAAEAAAGIGAVFVPLILLGATLLSEVMLVPLELGAILCALIARDRGPHHVRFAAAAGLLVGLATLTHANAAVLAVPAGLLLLGRRPWRPAGRAALAAVAAAAVVVGAWEARNAAVFHAFVPVSTEAGSTIAGTYNATAAAQTQLPGNWIEFWHDPAMARAIAAAPPDELSQQRAVRRLGLRYAEHHLGYVAKVVWYDARRMLGLEGRAWIAYDAGANSIPRPLEWAAFAALWLIVPLALLGVALGRPGRAPRALWLAPVLMVATALPLVGYSRLRTPADPFLIALAALGVVAAVGRVRARRSGQPPGAWPSRPT